MTILPRQRMSHRSRCRRIVIACCIHIDSNGFVRICYPGTDQRAYYKVDLAASDDMKLMARSQAALAD